jgi:hypothetical protein
MRRSEMVCVENIKTTQEHMYAKNIYIFKDFRQTSWRIVLDRIFIQK